MIGRAGSGRARKLSMSFPRSATIRRRSGAGVKERRQPGVDILGDLLRGAVFRVAIGTRAGETLELAGNVVGGAGEGGRVQDGLAGGNLDQLVARIDTVLLIGGQGGVWVEHQRRAVSGEADLELVCGGRSGGAAVKLECKRV